MYSRCIYICPYYRNREKLSVRCEGGELKFHDGEATSDYVRRHCASERWKGCSLAAGLNRYYERMDKDDEEVRRNQKTQV